MTTGSISESWCIVVMAEGEGGSSRGRSVACWRFATKESPATEAARSLEVGAGTQPALTLEHIEDCTILSAL